MDNNTAEIQELVRASKSVIALAYSEQGLVEKDCEAVLFYALELLNAIEPHCEKNHRHEALECLNFLSALEYLKASICLFYILGEKIKIIADQQ